MKREPEHFSPVKQENRKKVNVENTAKIPVLGASSSSGADWRDPMLQPPPTLLINPLLSEVQKR